MHVTGLMRQAARYNAHRTAIVYRDRRLTFAAAWDRGVRVANGLIAMGLEPGDRVGVLEDNSIEAQDLFAGASIAGLVRVPLYARNSFASHVHMLEHAGCRALVVSQQHLAEVDGIEQHVEGLDIVQVRDEKYETWIGAQSDLDPMLDISPDDWYIVRHTGGTTGKAKGVAYTHRSWLAAGRDWFYNFPPMQAGEACLHVGPISHGSGYLYTPTWLSGGVNVLVDHFDPADTVDVMESERVAYMFLVPAMLNAVARVPGAAERDWSSLKVIQIGGAPVNDDTALLGREVFGDVLYQGYGQTEALPVCMMGPKEWFSDVAGSNPLRSAGRALPFAHLEIRNPENPSEEVPIGSEGEIAIKCDGQMLGFWDDEDATAERMTEDGFVLTGDIGRLDDNAYLYVLDRKDDMIISGGFNIWPAELENVIQDHEAVVEVAVIAAPHERWGETPIALCVVDVGVDDAAATEAAVIELCVERLGSYKKPSRVEFRTEPLPKSPVGKLQRKVLREPYWVGHDRRVSGN